MNKIRINILLGFLVLQIFCACESIHEFPNGKDELTVDVNVGFRFNAKNLKDISSGEFSRTFSSGNVDLRVIIGVYKNNNPELEIDRRVIYLSNTSLGEINLKEKFALGISKYNFLVWVDYVNKVARSDQYYITDNLHSVYFKEPIIGCTDDKDCLSAAMSVDLTPYRDQKNVSIELDMTVKRHVAKYALIANDVEKFLKRMQTKSVSDINFFTAKVIYSTYMPNSYNVASATPNDSKPGLWHSSPLSVLPNGEVLVCFDYTLVNGVKDNTMVNIQIFDRDNTLINEVQQTIPIARDSLTIIRSDFLSRKYSPGISIDPNFEGEENIVIPDN